MQTSPSSTPRVITDGAIMRREVQALRASGLTVGLVPTMGALHAGHISLVARSMTECDRTVVTIFVNPTQFAPTEDLNRYPRPLAQDLKLLADAGAHLVFTPTAEEIYPPGHSTFVEVGGLSQIWEGAIRPGHFRGVATVVLKLFQLAPADLAYFGQKDYQQSVIVRRMVADLNVPIEIRVCPIVRDADGLALSSRNIYLTPEERRRALVLSQSLLAARQAVHGGERDAKRIVTQIRSSITATEGVHSDYAAIVDRQTLEELTTLDRPAVAIVAAKVGTTRLIDNELLTP